MTYAPEGAKDDDDDGDGDDDDDDSLRGWPRIGMPGEIL